jgi:hypothetical protein
MNGLLSNTPSPVAVRLVVSGLMLSQALTLILLAAPSPIESPPRSLIIVMSLLSLGSFAAAIIGIGSPDPRERWRQHHGA